MKKIIDAVKKLPADHRDFLSKSLKIEGRAARKDETLVSSLLNHVGIHSVFSRLTTPELQIMALVLRENNGITYGEIEKQLRLNSSMVEELANRLSMKLLVFVLKNRQRLHNKLDKIYLHDEIRALLNPMEPDTLRRQMEMTLQRLSAPVMKPNDSLKRIMGRSPSIKFVESLFSFGGIASYDEVREALPAENTGAFINDLMGKGIISLYHTLSPSFQTYILLNPDTMPAMTEVHHGIRSSDHINNHHHFLLNMMFTFDSVSSFGLFLTKQNEFRKIDKKRIEDSLLRVYGIDGNPVDPGKMMRLCLHAYAQLRCTSLKRDAVVISMKPLEKELDNPIKLLARVVRQGSAHESDDNWFGPPMYIPPAESMYGIIETLARLNQGLYSRLMLINTASALLSMGYTMETVKDVRDTALKRFKSAMQLLCIYGAVEISGRTCRLTDIGQELLAKISKNRRVTTEKQETVIKKIYINPDFSVVIPKHEVPSDAIYHLLTHSEVVKDDVVLHVRISRNSVVRAGKRGMNQENFINTLQRHAKSEIPQNLSFLLREWANQTIRVRITEATLLYSSHPELIDEIEYDEQKKQILERLTPHYAIIDRSQLDVILKKAQKKDAIITLFDDGAASG